MSRIDSSVSLHLLLQHPEVESSSLLVFTQHENIQSQSVIPVLHPELPLQDPGDVLQLALEDVAQLTILELLENQSQTQHQPELHSCGSVGLVGRREGGRGRRVRFFSGTRRLQRHRLDFQLHPQQRQGATKKRGGKNLCRALLSTPSCSEWKYRLQSPLLAKSGNHKIYVNRTKQNKTRK